jgi:hypothetical protein
MRYQARPEIVYRPEGADGAILVDLETGRAQAINATGSFVWERLDGARSLDEICAEMAAGFDEIPGDQLSLAADVERFVRQLLTTELAAEIAQPSGVL